MLQRDYLLEMIDSFVDVVTKSLERIKTGQIEASQDIETEVAKLISLDPATALALSPTSLVTMMDLSGIGDACAAYVAYALAELAKVYAESGQDELASLRQSQAEAIASTFGASLSEPPEEFVK